MKAPALRALAQLPDLDRLEVDGIWFDAPEHAVLGALPRLGRLKIIRSHIDDVGLESLARLRGLKYLEVETLRNRLAVSDRGLRAVAGIADLEGLAIGAGNVSCPGITDAGCELLSSLSRLEALRLPFARITDRCLRAIRRLPRLRFLEVGNAAQMGQGFEAIAGLPYLETLILVRARLTDDVLGKLAQFPALRRLYLLAPLGFACSPLAERIRTTLPKVRMRCDRDPSGGWWRSELGLPSQHDTSSASPSP